MATIVKNPPSNNSGGLMGIIILIIVVAIVVFLGFVYGLPAIKQMSSGDTQINVPDKIEVNVNETKERSNY